jgi:tricorn protease
MTSYDRPVTRALYVAILKDDEPSPFLPRSDEEAVASGDAQGGNAAAGSGRARGTPATQASGAGEQAAGGNQQPSTPPEVVIDFQGMARRIVDAPGLPLRNYAGLVEGPEGRVFVAESPPRGPGVILHRYTLADKEAQEFLTGVVSVTASHDRKKLLVRVGSTWSVADAGGAPPREGGERVSTAGMRILVDPRAEYPQMLRDGWRFMRDFPLRGQRPRGALG